MGAALRDYFALGGLWPGWNFGSVPASSRRMLLRCITMTSTPVNTPRIRCAAVGARNTEETPTASAADIDETEAVRLKSAATAKTASAITNTRQSMASAAAAPAETALPPRKP